MVSLPLSKSNPSSARLISVLESPAFFLAALGLFIILRVALLVFIPIDQGSDALWYHNRAVAIASGYGYSEQNIPTAYWPVGYPAFLAFLYTLFKPDPVVGQIANLVLAIAAFVLLYSLVKRHCGNAAAANLSVFLLATYPNSIGYVPTLANESLVIFLLLLGTWLLLSRLTPWRLIAIALVFGFGCLIKPQLVFFPGLFLLLRMWLGREPRSIRRLFFLGISIYAGMAAVLVPWAVRNTLVLGEVVLVSTNSGSTLLTGNNPSARGGYTEDDDLVRSVKRTVATQVAADRQARRLALNWIKENPDRFLALIPLKIWHLWAKDGESEWAYQAGYANYDNNSTLFRTVRWANQFYYFALMAGFVAALWLAVRYPQEGFRTQPLLCVGLFLSVYLTLISIVFSGQSRFHAIAMPFIISACAATLTRFIQTRRTDERPA